MKGIWIQLPVPDFNFYYLDSNIPLAAGYTILNNFEFLKENKLGIEILSQEISSLASDLFLINYILENNYDLLFFTSYMWNIERNLYISKKVKEIRNIKTIFGGPEISKDSPWLGDKNIDVFFIGESEGDFKKVFLEHFPEVISGKPYDVSKVFKNPYSEKVIECGLGKNFFLETMRGCPYRCKYCFYSKNRVRVRFYHKDLLKNFFKYQREFFKNSKELYILDPSFEVHPDLKGFLRKVANLNTQKLPIHTEIRAEKIDSEVASLMKETGFKSVELGLQSTSETVLSGISRKTDLEEFLNGVVELRKNGIDPQIGMIIGLPGDTIESFYETVSWLKKNDLSLNSEAFILSLLPQTELREGARHKNLKYMERPPYFVLDNGNIDERGIFNCIKILEDEFNIEYYPWEVPNLLNSRDGMFIGKIEIFSPLNFYENLNRALPELSNVMTVDVVNLKEGEVEYFLKGLLKIYQNNPYMLFNIVFEDGAYFNEGLLRKILDLLYNEEHYYNRLNYYREDFTKIYNVRLHMKGDISFFKKKRKFLPYFSSLIYEAIEDIDKIFEVGDKILFFHKFTIHDLKREYSFDELKEIKKLIPNFFDTVIFENKKIFKKWNLLFEVESANILKLLKSVRF